MPEVIRKIRRSRTFRVFVSSTFTDMKAERNALHKRVFPKLRELCQRHGFCFQAIDLRWGVSDEAALDQQTLNICLRELKRCQEISPQPNFILLLGDRYGWRPLPSRIEAGEFESLLQLMGEGERQHLLRWYRRDDNALPAEYVLLAREGGFIDRGSWEGEEQQLRRHLGNAADRFFKNGDHRRAKYFKSATHQEIDAGITQVTRSDRQVFAYQRNIERLPRDSRAGPYRDFRSDGSWDSEAGLLQEALGKELQRLLPGGQLHVFHERATPRWRHWFRRGVPSYEPEPKYLEAFCNLVESDLRSAIEPEMADFVSLSEGDRENLDHKLFAEERARHFVGRRDELERIGQYLTGSEPFPLVVHGVSGSGKTALMSRAFQEAGQNAAGRGIVLARLIGATPGSTNLRSLLTDLGWQLNRVQSPIKQGTITEVPDEIHLLVAWFHEQLRAAGDNQPVILFLDALDQLGGSPDPHTLFWLQQPLPQNVKIVISVLDRSGDASGIAAESARRVFPEAMFLEVLPLTAADGEALLTSWLADAGRQLTERQWRSIMEGFAQSGLPLWLRFAFDQARAYRSFDEPVTLPADIPQLINARLDRLSLPENHGPMLVKKALGYLAAARRGLSEDELLDVLALDEECWSDFLQQSYHELPEGQRSLPVIFLARLLGDLGWYVTERRSGNAVLLNFYHRQLGECIATRFQGPDNRSSFHQTLVRYFESQTRWLETEEEQRDRATRLPPTPRPANLRKADELPWQLIELARLMEKSGSQEELADTRKKLVAAFSQLEFLESKAEGGLIFDLAGELGEAAAALPVSDPNHRTLHLLGEALQRESHFISRHPTTLFQCLWNSAWWHDCPEALQHYDSAPGWLKDPVANAPKLHVLLENWRREKEALMPGFVWCRSLRPPNLPLGLGFISKFESAQSPITDAVFAPDGQRIISASEDGSVQIWDLRTGRELQRLRGTESGVTSLDVSANGQFVILGCKNGQIAVWDLREGLQIHSFWENSAPINTVAVSPDGQVLATGSHDGSLILWSLRDGGQLHHLRGHEAPVNCLSFSTDGFWIASGSGKEMELLGLALPDCSIRLWNVRDGKELMCLRGHRQSVTALVFSRDGRRLFSGSRDETIRIWDPATGKEERTLGSYEGAIGPVTDLALFENDGRIASAHLCHNSYGYYTAPVRVYDLQENREIGQIPGENDVAKLLISRSSKLLGIVAAGVIEVFPEQGIITNSVRLRSPTIGVELTLSPDGLILMWRNAVIGVGYFGYSGWDLQTWQDLSLVSEEEYEKAVKAGRDQAEREWHPALQATETGFSAAASDTVAAWIPQVLEGAVSTPNGRMWAARQGDHVYLIALEGTTVEIVTVAR